ncbi:MAG TPA: NADH-quinone oxidoreductase subunit C [Selenomonadales bacterium]|nr:NADH-quinone oxidoreductase subunit C [Selenomonadales bacterium]
MLEYREVSPDELRKAAAAIHNGGARPLTAMFANDERGLDGGMAIYCLFADGDKAPFIGLKCRIAGEPWEYPSLAPDIPAASWYEREINDLFGIVPAGHPDLRPLVLHENWPRGLYPLRKDFDPRQPVAEAATDYPIPDVEGQGVFEVPVGPIHAGIIEPGHFRFSQAGENIINLEAKLFFTHRGIEKAVEGLPVADAFYRAERICGACTVSHALAFAQAVEGLAGAAVPARAESVRVLAAELERLYNHAGDIGNLCAGVGFAVGISHGARLKERLMRLNERVAGNRFLRGMVVPGGVAMDVTAALTQDIAGVLHELEGDLKGLLEILHENNAFLDRVNTTGILSTRAAVDLGAVGVAARASGVNADWRRDLPYSLYPKLDFKVPVYHSGDVAARLWVRADEAFQAIGLIRQVLYGLPEVGGELRVRLPELPAGASGAGWSESARGGNLHWLMTGKNSTVYRLFVRSASYPNWPAVAVAAPGNIIPDFPLVNKSFELCYACIDR